MELLPPRATEGKAQVVMSKQYIDYEHNKLQIVTFQ